MLDSIRLTVLECKMDLKLQIFDERIQSFCHLFSCNESSKEMKNREWLFTRYGVVYVCL